MPQAEMLLNISKTVAAYETLDDMLRILVDMITEQVDADRATIFMNDPETVAAAKDYLTQALAAADGLSIGAGRGPVHHFYKWWTP